MRIASAYYTHKPGGFCGRLYRLLGALADRGHEVTYLSLDCPPKNFPINVNWQRIPFPLSRRSGILFWLLFTIWCPIVLLFAACRLKCVRVVAFNPYYSAMWKPTRMILGTTIVLFVRSLVYEVEKVKGTPALLRLFSSILEFVGARAATSTVCMTESMRESFASFSRQDPHTIAVLPNDVPPKPTFSRRSETGTTTIVTSGVLDSRKNVSLILDALSILPTPGPAVTLHIVGDGPLAPRLKARTHELHLNDQVTFTGWVPSLAEEYERASLVVHPSLHEGMPNSIMEAFASDVPVLAADTPELRELLLFDELLFDPHDPHSLASKLSAFVRSSEHRALISLLCSKRAVVYSFDWNARAAELVCA